MTYDPWLVDEPDKGPTPTEERLKIELAETEKDIAWNERRLANLVFGEEDRQQTADLIADLRKERQRLLEMLGNG